MRQQPDGAFSPKKHIQVFLPGEDPPGFAHPCENDVPYDAHAVFALARREFLAACWRLLKHGDLARTQDEFDLVEIAMRQMSALAAGDA